MEAKAAEEPLADLLELCRAGAGFGAVAVEAPDAEVPVPVVLLVLAGDAAAPVVTGLPVEGS